MSGQHTSAARDADATPAATRASVPPPFAPGQRFARRVTFDADSIRSFATACGDANPLHHDDAVAKAGPFGVLIASGPHVTALMMGLDATSLSHGHLALGLGFTFRFVRAVPAGVTLTLEWTVTAVKWKESLDGYVVDVAGRAADDAGLDYVTATGSNLIRH
ncbi:MAG TPA: MaoC family dehydratase [Casimicrobiaceae bacterium]